MAGVDVVAGSFEISRLVSEPRYYAERLQQMQRQREMKKQQRELEKQQREWAEKQRELEEQRAWQEQLQKDLEVPQVIPGLGGC